METRVENPSCFIEDLETAAPFTPILDNLSMGSEKAAKDKTYIFDVYVSTASEVKPPKTTATRYSIWIPLKDADWNPAKFPEETKTLLVTTKNIANLIHNGKKVLVYCRMGMNRSGLTTALVLLHLGYSADKAIRLIKQRHTCVLFNKSFEAAIRYIYDTEFKKSAFRILP
jgi:hypothetical protein